MSDIRNRLLFLATQYPELSGHFLELARMGVGEGVPYQPAYEPEWDEEWDSEMMADAAKRNLVNPISTSCGPIQKHDDANPNPTKRGDGDCYQKHYEYGSANSKNKSDYMKRYRALQKAQGVTHAPDGKLSGGRPQGGKPNPNATRSTVKKKANLASLREELDFERSLNRVLTAAWRGSPKRKLNNPSGDKKCYRPLKEWSDDDLKNYARALIKGETHAQCYNTHRGYGVASKQYGNYWKSTGKGKKVTKDQGRMTKNTEPKTPRQEYDRWYNENVRTPNGPKKGVKRDKSERPFVNQPDLIEDLANKWLSKQKNKERAKKVVEWCLARNITPQLVLALKEIGKKTESKSKGKSKGGFGGFTLGDATEKAVNKVLDKKQEQNEGGRVKREKTETLTLK